jgi:hypothetical protein
MPSPSAQDSPFRGACRQPLAGWHTSSVHSLPSSQASSVPPRQLPAWHASFTVQALPSSQAVPAGAST